jgi:hypothetical protein
VTRSAVLSTFATGALLGLAGCAMEARTDHDAKFSVASCHTYGFSDSQAGETPTATAFDNPLNATRMREAIATSLAARNLPVAADGKNADCLVSYAIGSRLEPDPWSSGYAWGYAPPGWGGRHYGAGGAWGAPYATRQGRVTVDLYDARSHQALWHATLDTDVTELTGSEADQRIRAAVATIFQKFPLDAPGAPASTASRS